MKSSEKLQVVVKKLSEGLNDSPELDLHDPAILGRLVFLTDWKATLATGQPITDVPWCLDSAAPDIPGFLSHLWEAEGAGQTNPDALKLAPNQEEAVNHVIIQACDLKPESLQQLVESTFPMLTAEFGVTLDLPQVAQDYTRHQPAA